MSGLLVGWGFYVNLPATPKLVLLAALDHADDDGTGIYAGVPRYAAKAGCSERTVQRHLAGLVEAGLLEVVSEGGGRSRTTEYRANVDLLRAAYDDYEKGRQSVTVPDGDAEAPKGDRAITVYTPEPRQPVTVSGEKGDTRRAERVTPGALNGDTAVSPEPSKNHPMNPPDHLTAFGDQVPAAEIEPGSKPAKPRKPRPPDLLWEAFVGVHGEPATDSERGKFNRIVKRLRDATPPVEPDEYPILVQAFVARYGGTQPAAATVSERIGELRHFVARGAIQAPNLDDLERRRRRQQIIQQTRPDRPGLPAPDGGAA